MKKYDVIIIGAGVSGCAVARWLAKKERKIAVLEKASDVCEGTSKANSGIVHAGHDAQTGTLKARLNVRGNEMMEALSRELDFPFRRNGSLVLCFEETSRQKLEELKERGEKNGVKGLEILLPEQVRELEPNISKDIVAALYAPTGGIVCPFGMNIALAENAAVNGVEFYLNHPVTEVKKCVSNSKDTGTAEKEKLSNTAMQTGYIITAAGEEFTAPVVINAAGVYADVIHNMVSERKIKITPRRGEYCLMDKNCGNLVHSTVFQLPSKLGKGILVTPTVHGNLLVGPTAEDILDKEGVDTTAEGLARVLELGGKSVNGLDGRQIITSFAGLRAHLDLDGWEKQDFIIEEIKDAEGFFDVAGIESPGLTCAPAIGEYVAAMVDEKYPAPDKEGFIAARKGIPSMAEATDEQRHALIAADPAYANVICRCELVTEGEIVEAIHRPVGATTLDGVKRRTRAGMGRCQSGFCSPKTLEILARELGVDQSEIKKADGESVILTGYTKDAVEDTLQDIVSIAGNEVQDNTDIVHNDVQKNTDIAEGGRA